MRGRGRRAGPARGPRSRAGKTGRVGRPVGLAGWRGPSNWLGGLLLLFLFLFFISFPLFEFKFGLEFEFKTDVTYSLEFREFCLAILYNKNRCGFVVQK